MKLQALVKSLSDVDEKYHDLYVETEDDTFVLNVVDRDYKVKLDEFRGNNRKFHSQVEDLTAQLSKFADVDPEKYKAALASIAEIDANEDLRAIKEGRYEEVVSKRTEAMRTDFEKQVTVKDKIVADLTAQNTEYAQRLNDIAIEKTITGAIDKVGTLKPGAMQDVLARARVTWKIDADGIVHPQDSQGQTLFGKAGNEMTPVEWAQGLISNTSYLFESAHGAGGGGDKQKQGARGPNIIDGQDPMAFGRNLEDIASGKTTVRH